MKKVVVLLVVVLATGVYYFSQEPKVRELFRSPRKVAPKPKPTPAPPTSPKSSLTRSQPQPPSPKRSTAASRRRAQESRKPAPPPSSKPKVANPTANNVVAKVLIQILAAKKLAGGISLGVSDEKIEVYGEVESAEKLKQIVEVLEKGREYRRIDVSQVEVGQ